MIKLVAFDLDGTLAPSKSPLPQEVAGMLKVLLEKMPVCIISGGNITQFENQVLKNLLEDTNLSNLHLMPTCGTKYLTYNGVTWVTIYENNLPEDLRKQIMAILELEAKKLDLWVEDSYGPIIEDRKSQVTYSALGQNAPEEEKKAWDPDGKKKEYIRSAVAWKFPELEVKSGGSTSVDITDKGIDKAYGMRELSKYTGIALEDMLFLGDRLDIGGNDYPVIATGVQAISVENWEDTILKLKSNGVV